jgi:polysaccharide export outer membrane protein
MKIMKMESNHLTGGFGVLAVSVAASRANSTAHNGKKGFDCSERIRENGITMKLSFRINDRLARLNGFLCAALSQALCGGARLRRVATGKGSFFRLARFGGATAIAAGVLIGLDGCQTKPQLSELSDVTSPPTSSQVPQAGTPTNLQRGAVSEPLVLREGDTVRISFPGSPSLNTVQQIRRDGKVSLALVGEFQAAGLTPVQMEKELVKLYAPQLVTKEVTVALESSAFLVYVTGAVARQGRLVSDRPMTALEAVLDAGVDYKNANLKSVTVIRRENGHEKVYTLNLKKGLQGNSGEPFYLKPSDIIFVRERFTWF